MPATVVLVHGAFHGAWCFTKVVDGLDAAGIPTVAVDLPGHGDDPAPPGDLYAHADWLRARLATIDGPVVLLGHSYGGAVITDAAAGAPNVVRLVYLCAVVPDAGEPVAAVSLDELAPDEGVSEVVAAMRADADGFVVVDPELAVGAFYADCADDDVAFALARLGPQNPASMQQTLRGAAWRTIPSTYVLCTEDRAVSPAMQRGMATRTTETVELSTSHSPFFSRPDLVVELLVRHALTDANSVSTSE